MSSIIIYKVEIHILLVKGPFLRSGHIMSAFRPSFCLNGSFARVFKIFRHRQTHTHTHTHTHGTDHSTPAQARGNNGNIYDRHHTVYF